MRSVVQLPKRDLFVERTTSSFFFEIVHENVFLLTKISSTWVYVEEIFARRKTFSQRKNSMPYVVEKISFWTLHHTFSCCYKVFALHVGKAVLIIKTRSRPKKLNLSSLHRRKSENSLLTGSLKLSNQNNFSDFTGFRQFVFVKHTTSLFCFEVVKDKKVFLLTKISSRWMCNQKCQKDKKELRFDV
jgi:hypothetical protein